MEKRVNQFFGQGGGVFWLKSVKMNINVFSRLSDIRKPGPRQILVLCPLPTSYINKIRCVVGDLFWGWQSNSLDILAIFDFFFVK